MALFARSAPMVATSPENVASPGEEDRVLKVWTVDMLRSLRVRGCGSLGTGAHELGAHGEKLRLLGLEAEALRQRSQRLVPATLLLQGRCVERIGPPIAVVGGQQAAAEDLG